MTPRPFTPRAEIRDVTFRDGLQLTSKSLPTDRKVQIIRELLALGVTTLEIGSMARPDLVPPLADTLDVVAALEPDESHGAGYGWPHRGTSRRRRSQGAKLPILFLRFGFP